MFTKQKVRMKILQLLYKRCSRAVSKSLNQFFYKIMQTSVFSCSWKNSKVVPTYKNVCKSDLGNYRQLSLLSISSYFLNDVCLYKYWHNFYRLWESVWSDPSVVGGGGVGAIIGKSQQLKTYDPGGNLLTNNHTSLEAHQWNVDLSPVQLQGYLGLVVQENSNWNENRPQRLNKATQPFFRPKGNIN